VKRSKWGASPSKGFGRGSMLGSKYARARFSKIEDGAINAKLRRIMENFMDSTEFQEHFEFDFALRIVRSQKLQ
jgi:hypothetical protein